MSDVPEQSKHTPTPWFVVDRGRKGEPMMSVMAERISGKGPSHEVAMCATGDSPQEMENANAAFIVEACNNYDALQSQNAELVKVGRLALAAMVKVKSPDNAFTDAVDALDAALSKAHP